MTEGVTYHVWEDHTLLYKIDGSIFYGVLQGLITRGRAFPHSGNVIPDENELRPATLADFERFRVSPKGHITLTDHQIEKERKWTPKWIL